MKKIFLLLAFIFVSFLGFSQKMNDNDFSSLMKESISIINTNLPMVVDNETRADNVLFVPLKTLTYNYTLVNRKKSDISNWDLVKVPFSEKLLNKIKTSPDLALFRDNDVIFVYNYYDKEGVFIFNVKIYPFDYKSYY